MISPGPAVRPHETTPFVWRSSLNVDGQHEIDDRRRFALQRQDTRSCGLA